MFIAVQNRVLGPDQISPYVAKKITLSLIAQLNITKPHVIMLCTLVNEKYQLYY